MRARIDAVGDLTAGMWRRRRTLAPLFARLGLEEPDPLRVDGRRRARGRA
jgi:hypothetical protein